MSPEEFNDFVNTMYGEEAKGNRDNLIVAGSSILNRRDSGRTSEFGETIPEITQKGYFAKINQNDPYVWGVTGKFPDKVSEKNYKKTMQVARGLVSGEIERTPGLFYMTEDEIKSKKKPDSDFDMSLVEEVGRGGSYRLLDYKKPGNKKSPGVKEDEVMGDINKSFKKAFRAARKAGKKTFEWNNEKYTTELK